jgi:signal transduction histidine kinase
MSALQVKRAERLVSLGAMASEIAHEINNPLNAILMNAELGLLSLNGDADSQKLERILRTIVEKAKGGGAITKRITEFSQTEHDSPDLATLADLNDVVLQARTLAKGTLHRLRVMLELEPKPVPPRLHLDETAVVHAVAELFRNAAQAGATRIRASTNEENETAVVTVMDNGTGIPKKDLPCLFDPFFTTRGDQGAMGLGLSFVHRVVSAHRGVVNVQSLPGVGTRFLIGLPLSGGEVPCGVGAG